MKKTRHPRAKTEYRKITLLVPADLLEDALRAGGDTLTGTVRKGLQLIAAREAFSGLRKMRGKVKFSLSVDEMRYE